LESPTYTVYAKRERAAGLNLDVSDARNGSIAKLLWELRPDGRL